MQHLFDVEIAKNYGIDLAIFLKNIAYWVVQNQANNDNYHEGRYWTYNKVDAYNLIFPYWSPRQIRRIIEHGISAGLLLKGNFNKVQYDRTGWYSLTDLGHKLLNISILPNGQMELTKRSNRSDQTVTAIPDNKQDNKQNERESVCPPTNDSEMKSEKPKSLKEAYPTGFEPSEKNISSIEERGMNPEWVINRFIAHARATGWKRVNWQAALAKWIMEERLEICTKPIQARSSMRDFTQERLDREAKAG